MHPWIEALPSLPLEKLSIPLAQKFVRHVVRFGYGDAKVIEARRIDEGKELVLIEVATSCGQRPAYAFNRREVLGVLFAMAGGQPRVLSAREDFPDTPHQNLSAEGSPYSPCIDNRSWEQAKLTYTPAELLHRILTWFMQASKGELHGADQPLDPNLVPCGPSLVLPKDLNAIFQEQRNIILHAPASLNIDSDETFLVANFTDEESSAAEKLADSQEFLFIPIEIQAERMTRMRQAPVTLTALCSALQERGCNLWDTLRQHARASWLQHQEIRVGILLKTPLIHPSTNTLAGDSVIGFILLGNLKSLAIALGVAVATRSEAFGDVVYGPAVPEESVDVNATDAIRVRACPVSQCFTPTLAARLVGRPTEGVRSAVLVGAGAVGALAMESLFREGRFSLTILDQDVLLPHNLARHTLPARFVGVSKARALAHYLGSILPTVRPVGYAANVLRLHEDHPAYKALIDANVILDASASVPVSRYLSDLKSAARRVSFFYNPAGTAAALLIEDEARSVDLRCLEASMYSMILSAPAVENFWTIQPEMIPYSGDCRALTTRLATSQACILSGLIAREVGNALDGPDAMVSLWCLEADGSVHVIREKVLPPECPEGEYDWTVRVLPRVREQILTLRKAKLPNETGGALLGVVDVFDRRIEILAIVPAPPDSLESPNGFTRGVDGLFDQVVAAMGKCNNEIRYIGEWHSHPPRAGLRPSPTDIRQMEFLTAAFSDDGCPGVQIIAGDTDINIILGPCIPSD